MGIQLDRRGYRVPFPSRLKTHLVAAHLSHGLSLRPHRGRPRHGGGRGFHAQPAVWVRIHERESGFGHTMPCHHNHEQARLSTSTVPGLRPIPKGRPFVPWLRHWPAHPHFPAQATAYAMIRRYAEAVGIQQPASASLVKEAIMSVNSLLLSRHSMPMTKNKTISPPLDNRALALICSRIVRAGLQKAHSLICWRRSFKYARTIREHRRGENSPNRPTPSQVSLFITALFSATSVHFKPLAIHRLEALKRPASAVQSRPWPPPNYVNPLILSGNA